MKKLSLFILSVIIFSCGEKKSSESGPSNILENFSFSVDTVVVDPGEEIINLSQGARLSSTDENKTNFYLLDSKSGIVNKINLDELKLVEIIPFEKEGPNGIGPFHSLFNVLPGENFVIRSFRESGIFSKEGKLTQDLKISPEEMKIDGLDDSESMNLGNQLTLTNDHNVAFALPSNPMTRTKKLVKMNLSTSTGEIISIPALDIVDQYQIMMRSGEDLSFYGERTYLQEFGEAMYICAQTTNKIYRFDYETDSLTLSEFDFSLVPNQKEIPIDTQVTTQEDFKIEVEKALTQISFEKLLFDEKTNRFYRFGSIPEPRKEGDERFSNYQLFLFAFDDQLNLIGETKVNGLNGIPNFPFFKDGKLWSYVNVDDELGFAVFTFNL